MLATVAIVDGKVDGHKPGMRDPGFFANIRYVDILQLIWPIINTDTNTNICIFFMYMCNFSAHLIAEIIKSL